MNSRAFFLTGLLAAAAAVGGCSDTLETGYVPRKLGSSAAERRAYYASPYTPESVAAQRPAGAPDMGIHRPGG